MAISAKQIKELRDITGSGFLDCRAALEDSNGDFDKAVEFLRKKGLAKASKRAGRDASEGVVEIYDHGNGRVGVMVEVNCETDFVARSEAFRKFAHEIALQVAASAPRWLKEEDIPEDMLDKEREIAREQALQDGKPEKIVDRIVDGRIDKFKEENILLRQAYIRDDKLSIQDFLHATVSTIGENVVIRRFVRWEVGEQSK
ncbi:MAG: translation elongation factor Ts [Chloroflexota bacterium]